MFSPGQPLLWAVASKSPRSLRVITISEKGEESIRRFESLGEKRQHAVSRSNGWMAGFIDQIIGQNTVPHGRCGKTGGDLDRLKPRPEFSAKPVKTRWRARRIGIKAHAENWNISRFGGRQLLG